MQGSRDKQWTFGISRYRLWVWRDEICIFYTMKNWDQPVLWTCSVCDPFAHAPLKELTREMYGCLRNTQVLNNYLSQFHSTFAIMENMIKMLPFQSLWCWDFQWICLILLKFYFYLFSKTAHVFFCPRVYSLSVPACQTSDKTHTISKLATTNHLSFLSIFFCKQSVNVFGTKGFSKHGSTCGIDYYY